MTCASYPPMSDDARTFEGSCSGHTYFRNRRLNITSNAERLFRHVQAIANEFPAVDIWDCLDSALQHTIKWHDAKKGPFDKLFERNLRERLRKANARNATRRRPAGQMVNADTLRRQDDDEANMMTRR